LLIVLGLRLDGSPNLQTVNIAGGQIFLRDRNIYARAAISAFRPLSNHNKLTVNTGKIAADLERQFPELKAVSVSLPLIGSRPTVYLQPATPKLLLTNQSGSFILDTEGRALIAGNQVPHLSTLHIPVVTDQSLVPIELGKVALPSSSVAFITEVVGQLQIKGIGITQLVLPQDTAELQVHMNGVEYYVRYNLHANARVEAGTYLAVKQYLDSNHKTPGSYIDVRVDGKAYYK
jgi:hypothetical protein